HKAAGSQPPFSSALCHASRKLATRRACPVSCRAIRSNRSRAFQPSCWSFVVKSTFRYLQPWPFASLVLPLLAALSFLQELDHRGGSNNPGGFVLFQGEEFLVAGHQKLGFAGFSPREQVAVLGVRRRRARGQVPAKNREVTKAGGEQFGRAGAQSRPEERPTGDVAELRNERLTGNE